MSGIPESLSEQRKKSNTCQHSYRTASVSNGKPRTRKKVTSSQPLCRMFQKHSVSFTCILPSLCTTLDVNSVSYIAITHPYITDKHMCLLSVQRFWYNRLYSVEIIAYRTWNMQIWFGHAPAYRKEMVLAVNSFQEINSHTVCKKSNPYYRSMWPRGFCSVKAPRLLYARHMKVVRSSPLRTGRLYPQEYPGTHF